jgi:hypothetical protein
MSHSTSFVSLLAVLWLAGAAPPAQAQSGAPTGRADVKLFEEGLADYFAKKPQDAANKLYQFLSTCPPTDENFAWGQYFMAKSFLDLGLKHAAASLLARVAKERSNPSVLPKALDELHALTDHPHDENLIDEQVFGSLDLGFLPEATAARAHYQQGLLALKVGNERWAQNHFSKLDENTPEASRAKYAVLVTRLRDAKGDIPKGLIEEFLKLSADEKLKMATRNEAMLAVARLRYELKDYPGALEANQKVTLPELDPGRASLYLEEAWIRYQLGQLRAAMGLLTTLDAPAFRDEFLPDKYILRALIYKDLCHYLPAKRAAKELTRRFADSLEAVRNREDLTKDLRLRRSAISRGATQRAYQFSKLLELESETLGRYAGSFGKPLFSYVTKLYSLAQAEATRVFQIRLEDSVRREADTLLRAAEQVRLLDYEIGLKLYERVRQGSKLAAVEQQPELTEGQVQFPFDGEYWNDELRAYRFAIQSRCIEEGAQ